MRKGSVFQDKQGRWRGTVELPKLNGKRRKKVFYGDSNKPDRTQQQELWTQINTVIYEIEKGLYIDESNATLEQYLREWHKVYTKDLAETTKELYLMYIEKHICTDEIGSLKIKDIIPMDIQKFLNRKAETLGNTVPKLYTFLNKVFKDACRDKKIRDNPCAALKKPKETKYTPTIYTEEQFNKLLCLTKGTFDEVCILLAGVCGFRRGEIFGIRSKDDIDFKGSIITIAETKVRFNKYLIKKPKTITSARSIMVPRFVIEVVESYLNSFDSIPEHLCDKYKPDSYSKHFAKLLSDNKLPHIRLHDLRHFNATLMLKYGISDKVASKRLGHSTVQTTREIYQHVTNDMDTQVAKTFEKIFGNKPNSEYLVHPNLHPDNTIIN